ncbi:hypothetical protein KUTeg_014258 [Tegillarca granosa]|uniref:Uncharacterized protein n=1 Tax=Tegillarca granosa TaxID=220873 RepID=A0ABQ9EW29_TEGGR|nr:hypothetical protein KUTeg_014258 [Tegillarca granosa]
MNVEKNTYHIGIKSVLTRVVICPKRNMVALITVIKKLCLFMCNMYSIIQLIFVIFISSYLMKENNS